MFTFFVENPRTIYNTVGKELMGNLLILVVIQQEIIIYYWYRHQVSGPYLQLLSWTTLHINKRTLRSWGKEPRL